MEGQNVMMLALAGWISGPWGYFGSLSVLAAAFGGVLGLAWRQLRQAAAEIRTQTSDSETLLEKYPVMQPEHAERCAVWLCLLGLALTAVGVVAAIIVTAHAATGAPDEAAYRGHLLALLSLTATKFGVALAGIGCAAIVSWLLSRWRRGVMLAAGERKVAQASLPVPQQPADLATLAQALSNAANQLALAFEYSRGLQNQGKTASERSSKLADNDE